MVDMTKAFGLPSGSIRAILMLIITVPVIYMLVRGQIAQIPEWYYLLVGMVVAFYFGTSKKPKEEIEEVVEKKVDSMCD